MIALSIYIILMSVLNNTPYGYLLEDYDSEIGWIGHHPHAVCLIAYCSKDEDVYWICGSSVLNQRILLTAAHCIVQCTVKPHKVHAAAGISFLDEDTIMRRVSKYIVHELFDAVEVIHDIGLCKLRVNLPLDWNIKRVIIQPVFPRDSVGIVAGWGNNIAENGSPTSELNWVKQIVWSREMCRKFDRLTPGTMCAVSESDGDDHPMGGDSGAGLVTRRYQEIGLVSYQGNKRPAVIFYTNVSYYYLWIVKCSKILYCA